MKYIDNLLPFTK